MVPNSDLYRRMSAPYESAEEAQAALQAFLDEVQAARERHRVAEVAIIAGTYTETDCQAMTLTLGNQGRAPQMARNLLAQTLRSVAEIHEAQARAAEEAADEIEGA